MSVSVSLFCVGDDVSLDGSDPADVAVARAGNVSGATFVASVSASDADEDELFALLSLIADVTGAIDATIQGCTRIAAANLGVATTQIAAAVSRALTGDADGNAPHWASTIIGAMTLTAHKGCDLMWCTSWDQGGTVVDPKGEYTTGWTTAEAPQRPFVLPCAMGSDPLREFQTPPRWLNLTEPCVRELRTP